VVERLPRKHKALGSVPSSEKKRTKKKKKKRSLVYLGHGHLKVPGSLSLQLHHLAGLVGSEETPVGSAEWYLGPALPAAGV